MGALFAHGIIPGSRLLIETGDVVFIFITSLIVADIIMLILGFLMIKVSVNILKIPSYYLGPIIMLLCVIGSYSSRNSMFDVAVMAGGGIIAFLGSKAGLDSGPLALGIVLGAIMEEALGVSLIMSQAAGSIFSFFFLRPLCILFIILSILSSLTPIILPRIRKNK